MGGIAAGGGDVVAGELDGLDASGAEFADDDELGEGAGMGSLEGGFGALDGGEFLVDADLAEAEAVIVVAIGIFAVVLGFVIGEGLVVDGGGDGLGPVQAPIGGDHALDQVKFGDGAGLEGFEVVVLELFKQGVALIAEDDRSGGQAMFDGVTAGALPALFSDGTVGFRAIQARCFDLRFGSHGK